MTLNRSSVTSLVALTMACAAVAVSLASYLETIALRESVSQLRDEVLGLSAEAAQRHDERRIVQTVIEERVAHAPAQAQKATVTAKPVEPSIAERFDRDGVRDPRRRSDALSAIRKAELEVDSVECTSSICAVTATMTRAQADHFTDVLAQALGSGVQLDIVYENDGAEAQRVTVYAR